LQNLDLDLDNLDDLLKEVEVVTAKANAKKDNNKKGKGNIFGFLISTLYSNI
jgi:hypothetical protein